MWPKEDYQEHMLGYIDAVQVEFERLANPHLQHHYLNEFYTHLEITSEHLWQLIWASDTDWEGFRYPLEVSCGALLRALQQLPNAHYMALSDVSFHAINSLIVSRVGVIRHESKIEMT